jgi:predicted PurR-regulated permease PerM
VSDILGRLIHKLIAINLFLLAFILLSKINLIHELIIGVAKTLLIPLFVSTLFFYIIRPLNNIFIAKKIGTGKASLLTLIICTFVLSGLLTYFSKYAYEQFKQISNQLYITVNTNKEVEGVINYINQLISDNKIYSLAAGMVNKYVQNIGRNFMKMIGYFMNTFSTVFLIVVIVFYMLKDGHKLKDKIISFIPDKYKRISSEILSESDNILSHYVTGQAKVALSLSIMIFTGYKLIGMPNAMLLSGITFILAFIPFVGFFISMIIPTIIALGMGIIMFAKLVAVFLIVQTLKGRVVVPAIMARSMKIHPLTDIFLVITAIAVGGPFAAFVVVPIYAILKNIVITLKKHSIIKNNS